MAKFANNPPRVAIADGNGNPTPEFYRWMAGVTRVTGADSGPFQSGQFLTLADHPGLDAERVLTPATGDLTGVDAGANSTYTLGLANTAVTPAGYGSAAKAVSFTVDAKGRLTAAAEYALTTSNVTEGTNLYYTNARARAALSGGTGISYSAGTGAIALDTTSARNVDHSAVSVSAGTGLSGGGTIDANRTINLANTTVSAASYGSATSVPSFTVDAQGRLTAASGNTIPVLASGTWTPTLTNTTNVSASSTASGQYLRVGNTVTCSVKVSITPTAAALTVLNLSLPVASALTADSELAGTAAPITTVAGYDPGAVYADFTNDRAEMSFVAPSATARVWFLTFTYRVI